MSPPKHILIRDAGAIYPNLVPELPAFAFHYASSNSRHPLFKRVRTRKGAAAAVHWKRAGGIQETMTSRHAKRSGMFTRRTHARGAALTRALMLLMMLVCAPALPHHSSDALAQGRKRQPARAVETNKKQGEKSKKAQTPAQVAAAQVADMRDEFVRLTGEYKKSLKELQTFYEKDERRAEEKLGKLKDLYREGLVSKRDVEAGEKALASARAKIDETRGQMKAADEQVAQALVEEKVVEQSAQLPPMPRGKTVRTAAYIRYSGTGSFSLAAGSGRVMNFYTQTFKKQLLISAFGQTAVHSSLRFDHRNAMDVALNPASAEGQALVNYLRANGIPFFAFFMAIPGSATGPHIHVGMPSHRIQ